MRLRQLTGLEQDKLRAEYDDNEVNRAFKSFIG
jgi:DNA gyrase/topoisomerase IV subunit A